MVQLPVAVWTSSNRVLGRIRTTIGQAPYVMNFQERNIIHVVEGCKLSAAVTFPFCLLKNPGYDVRIACDSRRYCSNFRWSH